MHPETIDELGPLPPLPPAEDEGAGAKLIRKTPWWSISAGIHVAAALILGFFWIVKAEPEIIHCPTAHHLDKKPPVFIPDPPPAEKNLPLEEVAKEVFWSPEKPTDETLQSDDHEEFKSFKGDDPLMVSKESFKGPSVNATIGTGGGAAGRFGYPRGGNAWALKNGGSVKTQDAVLEALKWLARHQDKDGSWGVAGYTGRCVQTCSPNPGHEDFDGGVTGLSLLAFLGAGYTHLSRDVHDGICFGDVVRKGIQWMMTHQDPEGCIGSRSAQKYMYNHTICALAMAEAYGLTGSNLFKDQAQKAVDFIVAAQNANRGWRYGARSGDNDSSVTGWAVMALKSAEMSGLVFPRAAYDGTRAWLDEVTEESYGRVGYDRKGTGKVYVIGLNEQFDHHEALTAIGVMSRIFMDHNKGDARLSNGCDLMLRDKPKWGGNATDFYYWYYASLALFQFDGPKGPKWKAWNEDMKNALVKNQNLGASGCRRGSWEPVDRWSGEGGRVYGTAINALTLEVYYRYGSVFGGR